MNEFIIVKHAGNHWSHYYEEDPKVTGLPIEHNCSFTHSGISNSIQRSYTDKDQADIDCEKINESNPCGYYGVVKVVE